MPTAPAFIVVEGLIGVGKTSLCRLLERTWGARLVLEPSEHNPFLEPFYRDPTRYAFPAQMFYLVTRWRQQDRIRQQDLFGQCVVSDYLFVKDRLFAEKTLGDLELDLYDRFAGALGEAAPVPDLVVHLDAPEPVLMSRIAERQAPGEELVEPSYIEDLRERYVRLFSRWDLCPVLRIDNTELDYVRDIADQATVLGKIEAALRGGLPQSVSKAQASLF